MPSAVFYLKKETLTLKEGGSTMLDAVYQGTGTLTWSSLDPNVATVKGLSKNRGYITAKAPGSVTVTATDGVMSRSCQVTVTSTQLQYPLVYQDETVTITVTKEWYKNAWCYAAHLEFTDYTRFFTACANGAYHGGMETTSAAAKRLGAVFAVNGPNMGWLNTPETEGQFIEPDLVVVRQGTVYNGAGRDLDISLVYSSENGLLLCGTEHRGAPGLAGQPVDALVEKGLVTDTVHTWDPLLIDGEPLHMQHEDRDHRTFMGTNGKPGDMWLVVSEGEYMDKESPGLNSLECAQFLISKGCVLGIELDGGGSSAMYFQGQVLNSHSRMERGISDFICVK